MQDTALHYMPSNRAPSTWASIISIQNNEATAQRRDKEEVHGSQGTRIGDAFGGAGAEQRTQHTQEFRRHHADRKLPRDGAFIAVSWLYKSK